MFDINANLSEFLASLEALPEQIEEAVEHGLDKGANLMLASKTRQIQKTYARPIPSGKNGAPKWERSGDWQNGQRIESEKGERRIVDTGRPSEAITGYEGGYAKRLADLPTGCDGVNRSNPAAEIAYEQTADQVPVLIEQEIANRLR